MSHLSLNHIDDTVSRNLQKYRFSLVRFGYSVSLSNNINDKHLIYSIFYLLKKGTTRGTPCFRYTLYLYRLLCQSKGTLQAGQRSIAQSRSESNENCFEHDISQSNKSMNFTTKPTQNTFKVKGKIKTNLLILSYQFRFILNSSEPLQRHIFHIERHVQIGRFSKESLNSIVNNILNKSWSTYFTLGQVMFFTFDFTRTSNILNLGN